MTAAYRRVSHAAHYENPPTAKGHDLEQWDVKEEPGRVGPRPLRPVEVPGDAEYHHGYLHEGVQHWVFVRVAPMTGTCSRCQGSQS